MSWWFDWPPLLLLLVVVNAGAELLLLKHGENLYCVSDEPDTPALAWNHDLNAANPPAKEEVYWSPSPPTTYSGLNCKPQLAEQQKCGDWDIKNWTVVKSYEKDLPPVLDFRWNDLQHEVVLKKNTFSMVQPSARKLYLTVSLLVSDSVAIELENSANKWRVVIDGWINHPNPRRELQWWSRNVKSADMKCDNCGGLILDRGKRWTTVTLKYEARHGGDVIKLRNHKTGDENTWMTNKNLNGVTNVNFSISNYSAALLGHCRIHSYDILEPTSTDPMTFSFTAADTARLCVSLTYISPSSKDQTTVAWLRFVDGNTYLDKEISSKGNEWRTVKHVFNVTRGVLYKLMISPVNYQGFAVGEVRGCSEQELRVSKMANSAANECTDLKHNTRVALKNPSGVGPSRSNPQVQCITNVIPNVRDCRGVLICSSSACSCAPGYHGVNCQLDCSQGYYGRSCRNACSKNCVNFCDPKTGACNGGCKPGYQGENCIEKCPRGWYGEACQQQCSENCKNARTCDHVNGKCTFDCTDGWKNDDCKTPCQAGRFGHSCSRSCSGHCKNGESCNHVTGECRNGCADGWQRSDCSTGCDDGRHGSGCQKVCGECKKPPCGKVTGACKGGCKSGYDGVKCHWKCTPGWYGEACRQQCSENCKNATTCDHVTGKCAVGCTDGWRTDDCKTLCQAGWFGPGCSQSCSGHCKKGETCNHVTGECHNGCADGWQGSDCSTECRAGRYGKDCVGHCGTNCNKGCHHVTGKCTGGCKEGFQGHACSECTFKRYGTNCEVCGHCSDNAVCDKKTGQCPGSICNPGYHGFFCLSGCDDGWYGSGCRTGCGECKNPGCDKIAGTCRGGCKNGYLGDNCHTPCQAGKFGTGCSRSCRGHCKNGETCNHVTGECLSGCADGWQGSDCSTACQAGRFGRGCSQSCSGHCKNGETCNHVTGVCLSGCADGWRWSDCSTACQAGRFGPGCSQSCSGHCKNGETCNHVTGECRNGCADGWQGSNCSTACPVGKFGPGCSQSCRGHCKNKLPCNHVSGECHNGCANGWQGSDCSTACPPGSYGFNCSQRCSENCKGGAICGHVTGHCTLGCFDNWTGDMCDHCISGRFGDGCNEVCSGNCRNNEPCNENTGNCEFGCQPGWMPHFCNETCTIGWYGDSCQQECSEHCKNARKCHHVTGKCNDGCENGYKNDDCKTLCEDGTYGEQCKMTCGLCKYETPCNKATGRCPEGCVGNVFGDKCDVCIAGKYGEYCELECSPNCKDEEKLNCDRVSGRCYRGCKPGFIGDKCEIKCPLGLYGENCSSTCGRCGPGAPCDASTGICQSSCLNSGNCALQQRCEENWEGERCDEEIKSSAGHWAWLLLLPLLIVILVLIWRRRARTKPAEELSLNVLPANGVSPKIECQRNIQRQVRPRAQLPAIEASPQPDVIPPPVRLNVSPPLPTRPCSVAPPITEVQSRLIPLFELAQYIEESVASGQLAAQHAIFPRGLTAPSLEAARQENLGKNRWRNVVPYDDSRVVLDPLPHKPHSNYINASYIDGYMKEKAFIATQGPKAGTVDDLWRLVWQENVTCIVMLCNLTEGGKTKCEQYWPEIGYCAHHSNEILVRTNSENAFLDHTERIFTVSRGNNDASRTVMQLHYTSWPDHGVPRYAHSLACVLRQVPLDNDAPILVHCSAGVGRTGTVILALSGYAMGQAEGVVDLLALLARIRSQRTNMVDNKNQYETAHRVLLELNTLPGSELPVQNFHAAIRSIQELGILGQQFWELNEVCKRDMPESYDLSWPQEKNRFPDIVPGTEGRVLLQRAGCSYVNAVYVHGLRSRDRYVVTQLPLPNTLGDFWLLTWQREAQMVVVLNMPEPNVYPDHVALWVEGGELSLPDHLKMRHVSVSGNALFDMHRVILSQRLPKRNEESREVCILSVKTWRAGEMAPHHPELLIRVWNEMQTVPETVVLACHDGATASGLMVSAALMLEHLQATRRIDVVSAVRRARRTRPQFVCSLAQFEFLHSVMLAQVESMDTYVNI